ncbi:MAG: alanine:cation symporter family protein [Acidobacteria bacterium]|nr:MAG: alanine:cation symporter family protein [Acidobacteriota bacterium]
MEFFQRIVGTLEYYTWSFGPTIGGESIPVIVVALLGTGLFLTLRLAFIQFRRLGHGFRLISGKYDDPSQPGDVSHFQALSTALSATVGIGNIAGVALAIHFGGPGALFWMWMTAILGMVTKFVEVTLSMHYRVIETLDATGRGQYGTASGGPMYYIERGLGKRWKPMAVFFAFALIITSFFTGNGIQANTMADVLFTEFGIPSWVTGLASATLVFSVIVGGITRIARVTSVLAPLMAVLYVLSALIILILNLPQVVPTLVLIFREAFQPTAGIAGTGIGLFVTTMMWGVRRGLFSNEAGQGSAPIAHAAAKTNEPVAEGVVALLGPFIDTLIICSMTGLVILITGVWNERIATEFPLSSGEISYLVDTERGPVRASSIPETIRIQQGRPLTGTAEAGFAWHDVRVEEFFVDASQEQPFSGVIRPSDQVAVADDGTRYPRLYGPAVENGAPLTALAFQRGLSPIGPWGNYIVLISVLLFAISTAIAWSYYGDRCVNYLLGPKAILPYKIVFVIMHFLGAVFALSTVWTLGDVALGMVTFPNLIALLLLSGVVVKLTKSYFERKPWRDSRSVER